MTPLEFWTCLVVLAVIVGGTASWDIRRSRRPRRRIYDQENDR